MVESREQAVPSLMEMGSLAAHAHHAVRSRARIGLGARVGVGSWLAALTLISVLLTSLPSGLLIWRSYQNERTGLEKHSLETARALTLAIDGEFGRMIATINALGASPFLETGDFAAFQRHAEAAVSDYPGGVLSLADRSGQMIISMPARTGEAALQRATTLLLNRVMDTRRPVVSDLLIGEENGTPLVAVAAPVVRNDNVVYEMILSVPPEAFATLLTKQGLPQGWIGAIADSTGMIVARSFSPERFVGQPFVPVLMERLATEHEGIVETTSLEGTPVFTVFTRSPSSGWIVALGIPRAELNEQVWRSMWITAGGVLALLATALALAFLIAQRIAQPIKKLIAPALAVGLGERVDIPSLGLREADDVGRSLASASRLLRKRAEERDRAEAERARVEAWLSLAMKAGGMGTWELDPITQSLVASESTDAIFGLPRDGRNRSIVDYLRSVHPQDVERLKADVHLGDERQSDICMEFRLMGPAEKMRWVAARGSRVCTPDGGKRIIGTVFDITAAKATEAALAKALQDKDRLLAQKEMLLRESNHRVKNSLQSVSAMLRLQAAGTQDGLLRQQLLQADQRVLIIARVHEHFYRQAEVAHKIEVAHYLRELCGALRTSTPRANDDIAIEIEADPVEMEANQALALALLVNELVTNALKYAFVDRTGGTINVTFRIEANGRRRLSVADNGCGLPAGFQPKQSAGLGMRLVQGFVRSLDGELRIDSSRAGARFTVLMPPPRSVPS